MADKTQKLVVEVTAKADAAQRQMAELDKRAKALEKSPVEIPVTADTSKAEADLKELGEAAEQAGKKIVDMGSAAGAGGLGRVKPAVQEVDDATKTLNRSADGTKNAMANLVGNTAQDVTGLSGAFGSLGVAIGQVAEYTADAANEGGGLGKALQGAASVAGPMLALSAAAFAFQKVMGDAKKHTEEAKAANDAFMGSLLKGTGVIENWGDALDDAFKADATEGLQDLNKFLKDTLEKTGNLEKTTTALGQLGLGVDDLGSSLSAADKDFGAWGRSLLESKGFSQEAAKEMTLLISENEKLGDAIAQTSTKRIKDLVPPDQVKNIENLTRGMAQYLDVVEDLDMETQARNFNETARATSGMGDAIDKARAAGDSELDIMLDVNDKLQEQARLREEGAQAAKDSGTILEQVTRDVARASDAASEAFDKAKKAQDDWLFQEVGYQGAVDDFTDSLDNMGKVLDDGRKKTGVMAESFAGNSKEARDNRDALAEVYENAVAMNGAMKDAGFSVEGAQTAMENAGETAYQMALQLGYPQEEAQKLKDKILDIPTLVSTDVVYSEKGYEERLAEMEALDRDIHNDVWFAGHVDRKLQEAIDMFNWSGTPGTVTPASAPAGRGAAPVAMTTAVPVATAAPVSTSRTVSVNVNMGGAIVADSFELQRVVSRAVRQGVRISGARRYQP